MDTVLSYLKTLWQIAKIVLPFFLIIRAIYLIVKKQKPVPAKELTFALFVVYAVWLASLTIFPPYNYNYNPETGTLSLFVNLKNKSAGVNFMPFATIKLYFSGNTTSTDTIVNVLGNIFMFSPLGALMPIIWDNFKKFGSILSAGFGTTILIEFVQYFVGRSSDIDDVLLNTLGVIIGFGIYKLICKLIS